MLTVFENLFLSPDEVCGLAFGSDCAKTFWPFDAWNVSLPGVPKPPVSPHVLPKVLAMVVVVVLMGVGGGSGGGCGGGGDGGVSLAYVPSLPSLHIYCLRY